MAAEWKSFTVLILTSLSLKKNELDSANTTATTALVTPLMSSYLLEEMSALRAEMSAMAEKRGVMEDEGEDERQLHRLSGRVEQLSSRLSSVEAFARSNLSAEVDANRDELEGLHRRVKHFIQSLLKVKELPAEVNAMERRLEAMDATLERMVEEGWNGVKANGTFEL